MTSESIQKIISNLSDNKTVFSNLFSNHSEEEVLWKPEPSRWCLLEVICHLYDEEREDFKARFQHVLSTPDAPLPPIDPQGWVESRNYMKQNFQEKLAGFLKEREISIQWLKKLENPKWDNFYIHPKFGHMSAKMFFANWLGHDYLHIRQIVKLKFDYLKFISGEDLNYAGNW